MDRLVLAVCAAVVLSAPGPSGALESTSHAPSQSAREQDEDAPAGDPCFTTPAVVRYLHAMQDRILDAWKLPEDGLANRLVVLILRVDGDGTLLKYELVHTSDRRLARSVKFAVLGASPFEAVPIEAFCLVERDIQTTFGNPARID